MYTHTIETIIPSCVKEPCRQRYGKKTTDDDFLTSKDIVIKKQKEKILESIFTF